MANNGGWIKISRDILNHWIAQDPERLKWWLDLIMMATHQECDKFYKGRKFRLKVGEAHASLYFLAARWKRDVHTVLRFIRLLESEGMVKRTICAGSISIISVCKYVDYQGLLLPSLTYSNTDQSTNLLPREIQGQKPSELPRELPFCDTQSCATKQELYNNTTTTSTQSGENSKNWAELLTEYVERLRTQEIDAIALPTCMALGIEKDEYLKLLEIFYNECLSKSTKHENFDDFRRHLFDWMRLQKYYENKKQQSNGSKKNNAGAGPRINQAATNAPAGHGLKRRPNQESKV